MILKFYQTGDPWHDWGLCELYDVLQEISSTGRLTVSPPGESGFTVEGELTPDEFGRAVHALMSASDRWNSLHPRFEEGKKIERCKPRIVNGRRVPGEKYEAKVSPEEWKAHGCRGENPPSVARNRCQRISNIPLTPKSLDALLLPEGGEDSFEGIAARAATYGVTVDVTQGANPMVAKHHSNGKVRGPSGSNSTLTASSQFLLPCFCATVSPWKPFVKEDDCVVLLPDNLPFPRALRLWRHMRLSGKLIHPDSEKGEMYRNLPLRADGDEAKLLVLLDALQDRLVVREQTELLGEEIPLLNDWIAIHFNSGTNVTIGAIHRIEVPGEVFPLLAPIPQPEYSKDEGEVSFVKNCLAGIRVEDMPVQSYIARSLFLIHQNPREAWRGLMSAAMMLYKNVDRANNTNRNSAQLLSHFYTHFARRILAMTEAQIQSCRKIGELIGSAFHRDLTIISRLHNTSSPGDLRANMELVAFRLFKMSTGEDMTGLWNISPEEFQSVLDLAGTDDWQSVAHTISAFASLKAFNQNLSERRSNA